METEVRNGILLSWVSLVGKGKIREQCGLSLFRGSNINITSCKRYPHVKPWMRLLNSQVSE